MYSRTQHMGLSFSTKVSPSSGSRLWRLAVVAVVIVALAGTLATRVFHGTFDQSQCVRSGTAQAMRQHLDRDALGWTAPVVHYAVLDAPAFYPRVAPAGPPVRALLIEENLYNRPPPSC